nr:hypothetical protein GCM10020092_044010 [Actinoplanes digitatis]
MGVRKNLLVSYDLAVWEGDRPADEGRKGLYPLRSVASACRAPCNADHRCAPAPQLIPNAPAPRLHRCVSTSSADVLAPGVVDTGTGTGAVS